MSFKQRLNVDDYAKLLRRNPTKAEREMARYLHRQPFKLSWIPQHPIGKYIADFYCESVALVIEVDGRSHEGTKQRKRDLQREEAMAALGITTLRFSNEEILFKIEWIDQQLGAFLEARRYGWPTYSQIPQEYPQGEDAVKPLDGNGQGKSIHVFNKCYGVTTSLLSKNWKGGKAVVSVQNSCEGAIYVTQELAEQTASRFGRAAYHCGKHWHVREPKPITVDI